VFPDFEIDGLDHLVATFHSEPVHIDRMLQCNYKHNCERNSCCLLKKSYCSKHYKGSFISKLSHLARGIPA
jgi:hypothetical protein